MREVGALRHVADPLVIRGTEASGVPKSETVPWLTGLQSDEGLDQGGLARAVGAEERDHLSGIHVEAHVAHDRPPAEDDAHAVHDSTGAVTCSTPAFARAMAARFWRIRER